MPHMPIISCGLLGQASWGGFRDPVPGLESVLFLRSLALLHLKGILVAEAPEGALIASLVQRGSCPLG